MDTEKRHGDFVIGTLSGQHTSDVSLARDCCPRLPSGQGWFYYLIRGVSSHNPPTPSLTICAPTRKYITHSATRGGNDTFMTQDTASQGG
ncbi:MAG: hypothetical protein ACI3Y5_09260 [Prevotella sp.]